MTVRTACISYFGNIFSVSATTILTDEHTPIFILYFKHELAAIWALGSCHIVMFKRRITLLYLLNNFFGVTFHFRDEMVFLQPSFSDQPQLLFPFSCKSRRFQIFRNEIKQLSAFWPHENMLPLHLHVRIMEKLFNNVSTSCYCSESACFVNRRS